MKFSRHPGPASWRPILLVGSCLACSVALALASDQPADDSRLLAEGRNFFFDPTTSSPPASLDHEPLRRQFPAAGAGAQSDSSAVSVYKEPSSWIVAMLKEMFSDIDWQTIEEARVQIEKFIHKVNRIAGSFRQIIRKAAPESEAAAPADLRASHSRRSYTSRWWTDAGTQDKANQADAASVKQMLERVACFVGYARLMNLSNEALAELDASKVVTNLFGAGSALRRNSSVWSWLG